ncbi:MAG TPA: EAL domain-containing protein [Patescibacteria group bacterium]|nr:EAL domain-containing protein [Patescibacteria group bacterium]
MQHPPIFSINPEHVPGLVGIYNAITGEYLFVGKNAEKILGYSSQDFLSGGVAFTTSLVHPEDLGPLLEKHTAAVKAVEAMDLQSDTSHTICFEYRLRHKNGNWVWVQTNGRVLQRTPEGKVEQIINISTDITEQKNTLRMLEEAQQELEARANVLKILSKNEEYFRMLVETVEDYAIFALDAKGKIITWNEGVQYIFGFTQEEITGKNFDILFTLQDRMLGLGERLMHDTAPQSDTVVHEGLLVRKDESSFHAVVTMNKLLDEKKKLLGYSVIIRDITEKKEAEETIRYQAFHDTLTGLANRDALYMRFAEIQGVAEKAQKKLALLFIDLDRFKVINDTLGHAAGDIILREIGDRLKRVVDSGDIVARLGGDEFILLLTELEHPTKIIQVAQKVLDVIAPVIRIQNNSLRVTASIGISAFPEDGLDLNSLLKNADIALYRAKEAGRNRYQFYNYKMNLQSARRLFIEQDLRVAVAGENQFEIAYQPFIHIQTNKIIGMEALIRWHHPRLGMLYPADFIPLAEETGMIIPMGDWLLKTACEQGRAWSEKNLPFMVSINLSARQFAEHNIVEKISRNLEETGFDPRLLEIEITESVAMENVTRTNDKMQALKQKGVSIAIDDFGTGYSSLSYLKRFPVRKLKIDRSFIKQANSNPHDYAIVKAVIKLGQSLGLLVCAEGVENKYLLNMLSSMGCELAQGYHISKPLFVPELTEWLNTKNEVPQNINVS